MAWKGGSSWNWKRQVVEKKSIVYRTAKETQIWVIYIFIQNLSTRVTGHREWLTPNPPGPGQQSKLWDFGGFLLFGNNAQGVRVNTCR